MTTYQEMLDELDSILSSYKICRQDSDIFTRIMLIEALQLDAESLSSEIHGVSLVLLPTDSDPKLAEFILTGDESSANKFQEFLLSHLQKHAYLKTQKDKDTHSFVVKVDGISEELMPIFKSVMEEAQKNFSSQLDIHRKKSYKGATFTKQRYRARQLMDAQDNAYGRVMNEINDNLAKWKISPSRTQVIINSLMALSDSNHLLTGSREKNIYFASYYPDGDGKKIVFDLRIPYLEVDKLILFFKKHAKVSVRYYEHDRYPVNTIIKMDCKDFYEKILPLFADYIQQFGNEGTSLLLKTYQALSREDPDVHAAASQWLEPVTWVKSDIKFAETATGSKHGFFSKVKNVFSHCCKGSEEKQPSSLV